MKTNNSIFIFEAPTRRTIYNVKSTQTVRRSTPARRYNKPFCLREFEKEYTAAHYAGKLSGIPVECRAHYSFDDKTANGLTRAIVAWLNSHGAFGARVNTTGVFDRRTGKYRRSGATNGMADVTAIVAGKHVSLEIKHGNDKPREAQIKVQQQVQQAGGIYEFVHTFEEFLRIMFRHGFMSAELLDTYGLHE